MNPDTASTIPHGRAAPPPEARMLRAGPLTALYDPSSGFLRRIRLGSREVLRGIYAAVRDENWNTVPGIVTGGGVVETVDAFTIQFRCAHRAGNVAFEWAGSITGGEDGRIEYTLEGEAKSDFLKNRVGFCVLHPVVECAGARAVQRRADGASLECRFPERIEPQIIGQSPFRDLVAMAHEVEPGVWAELTFEGELFEMEDQRNWSDASFKTYCTPLALPFPVEMKAGTVVRQRVVLTLRGETEGTPPPPRSTATPVNPMERTWRGIIDLDWDTTPKGLLPLPKLGFGMPDDGEDLDRGSLEKLRRLRPSHLRVDLKLDRRRWRSDLEFAMVEAGRVGCALEIAAHLPGLPAGELEALAEMLRGSTTPVARVLVFRGRGLPATADLMAAARVALGGIKTQIGTGGDANFCELNREHALGTLPREGVDFLGWSMNPQVHARDSISVMESLESIGEMVGTARGWGMGPCVVSPITLRPRFNPVATKPGAEEEQPPADDRQMSLFGMAWTMGCLVELVAAGVAGATFYETTGRRGLMESGGAVYPLYHCFSACAGFPSCRLTTRDPRREVAALMLAKADGIQRLVVANLSSAPRVIGLPTAAGRGIWRRLEEANESEFRRVPDRLLTQPGLTLLLGKPVVVLEPLGLGILDLV